MESKEKIVDDLVLEKELEIEANTKKKSLIKFIHVFESDVDTPPKRIKKIRSKKNRDSKRERRRSDKRYKESFSYYSLNPRKFTFSMKNL